MEGILTALITPFKNEKIDWDALSFLIDKQIQAGITGLIISGTTGESPTLSVDEKKQLFKFVLDHARNSIKIVAGTGNYSTIESIELSQWAADLGVDALLTVVPYYNKPSQEGLFQHFSRIADAVSPTPIILYNVPSRTVTDLLPETIARLAKIENIKYVKEATGKMERVTEILEQAPHLTILSGDDTTFFQGMKHGMHGIISVASNIFPEAMVELYQHFKTGNMGKAESIDTILTPFYKALFCESNPVPVKTMAALKGWISPEVRLPLVQLSSQNAEIVQNTLNNVDEKLNV